MVEELVKGVVAGSWPAAVVLIAGGAVVVYLLLILFDYFFGD